jgi:hypothetical protein
VCRGQRPPIARMLSLAMMLIKPALLSYPGMLIVSLLASGYRHDNRVVLPWPLPS